MAILGIPRVFPATLGLLFLLTSATRASAQAMQFYSLAPCRAFDSRPGSPLPVATVVPVLMRGVCGVPSDAKVVAVNVTAITPTCSGYLTLWPTGGAFPLYSNLNMNAGEQAIANSAVAPLGPAAPSDLSVAYGSGGGCFVHVAIDLTGYFR